MTHEIKLTLSTDSSGGSLVPQAGRLVASTSRTRFAGDAVIIQNPINIELVNGLPVTPIVLADLPEGVSWHIRLYKPDGVFILERYIVFPAGIAPNSPVNFDKLVDVNKATALPNDDLTPAPWRVVIAGLTARIKAVEDSPNTGSVGFVDVIEGNEPRPVYPFVIWKDNPNRVGDTRPDHMYDVDMWFARSVAAPEPDITAPSAPGGLVAFDVLEDGFTLDWNPSTDSIGVTGYEVTVGGVVKASTTAPTAIITGLAPAIAWSARVRARDAVGNWSALSAPLEVLAPTTGTPQHTVFGAGTKALTFSPYNDGGTLRVLNGFYTYGAGKAGWRAVGMRLFVPSGFSIPSSVTVYLYAPTPGSNLPAALTAVGANGTISKAVTGLQTGWNDVRFDTPVEMTPGQPVYVGYEFPNGAYFAAGAPVPDTAIISDQLGLALISKEEPLGGQMWHRSAYRLNGGAWTSAGDVYTVYGVDIIVDEG